MECSLELRFRDGSNGVQLPFATRSAAGLYEELGRYLHVNRGFGVLAFPGRVGIWPEITVLELKRK